MNKGSVYIIATIIVAFSAWLYLSVIFGTTIGDIIFTDEVVSSIAEITGL